MAVPADPLAAAGRVKTEQAAARLYFALETELANGGRDDGWQAAAAEATDDLAADFGGHNHLRQLGGQITTATPKPTGSHGARRRAASPKPTSAAAAGAASSPRKPAPRTTRRAPRAAGRRALRQTGIPGATTSASAFAFQVLGLMIGMALLYLVLTNAERAKQGAGVLDQALSFATGLVHAFISPRDPLAGAATSAKETPADIDRRGAQGPQAPASDVLRGKPALGGLPHTYTNSVTTP